MAVIIFLVLLAGSALLRTLISLYPRLDISLDVGTFHTQLRHITSLTIWITISLICNNLMIDLRPERIPVLTALLAMGYPIKVVVFIYKQWVMDLSKPFQLIYIFPCIFFLKHTFHQAYFVISFYDCLWRRRSPSSQ